jgi:hypothetical protein
MITATNTWLLISKSRGDSNRCTPYRGKPNQHATHLPCSVRIWFKTICISRGQRIAALREMPTTLDRGTALKKKGSRHNPQYVSWPIHGSVPSFSPEPANDDRLLGLPGPYHRYAIGTLNTYSWGPTNWSLTDTAGGYNLRGTNFPRTHSRPSQPAVSTFY